MIDRGQDRWKRIKRTAKWTLLAVGVGIAGMAANAGCDARASAESSNLGNLHGFGYDIDASSLGTDIVRITARGTMLPMRGRDTAMNSGIGRAKRDCGAFEPLETASEKNRSQKGALIIYGSVPNRLACLGQ